MQSESKWTLNDVKKKIENLEMRLVKAKRFHFANARSSEDIHEKREANESKTSLLSTSSNKKHYNAYIGLARKFINFANSI